jgi:hypothetical protein
MFIFYMAIKCTINSQEVARRVGLDDPTSFLSQLGVKAGIMPFLGLALFAWGATMLESAIKLIRTPTENVTTKKNDKKNDYMDCFKIKLRSADDLVLTTTSEHETKVAEKALKRHGIKYPDREFHSEDDGCDIIISDPPKELDIQGEYLYLSR